MQDYLEKLQRELKYRNYSPNTIEVYNTCVKYFLKYLKNDISNITKEIIIDFTLYLQSYSAGLRVSEIINLKVKGVKGQKDRITIISDF